MTANRRGVLTGGLALAACGKQPGQAQPVGALPPLRSAPFPVGTCVQTPQLEDPVLAPLLLRQFSQVTAEFEMKMEVVLRDDGGFDFARADRIADFASAHGLRLHGHTLIWYAQSPPAFERVAGDPRAFAAAYRNYILAVAGRYRGRAVGWDVVNEPVAEDGEGYRECLWRRAFGMGYVARAFAHAREAEPAAPLFMNDYNLETNPSKRASFLRLAESLLRAGAPLSGLGTQTHVGIDLAPGAIRTAVRELAGLGLPIHVSEMDVSTRTGALDLRSPAERAERQARVVGEAVDAFAALPPRQRYAVTVWGIRDGDSWLRHPPNAGDGSDRPLLLDDEGRLKPASAAFVRGA